MLKKIIEKIFRRKELADLKEDVQEKAAQIKRLTTGDSMHLSQQERRLILLAIKFPAFWTDAHPRPYKAYQRILRKDLIEKLKLSIKAEDDDTTATAILPIGLPIGSPGTQSIAEEETEWLRKRRMKK